MRPIAVVDLETDPFAVDQIVKPFAAGFYDGSKYVEFWGGNCVAKMVDYLLSLPEPYLIFAHNGGKFDWLFFLPYLSGDLRLVHSRIIYARLGQHEVRDSYAIMPFPLAAYDKDEIDYELMNANRRDENRDEISRYLKKDCVSLFKLVTGFLSLFGDKLTVGSASMRQIKDRHKFTITGEAFDDRFRSRFYFGGRNQCFASGVIHQRCDILDINSQYPYSMKAFLHPIGGLIEVHKNIRPDTVFVVAEGRNDGAFPVRTKIGLDFTVPYGTFHTTIHEYAAALDTGAFEPTKIIKTYSCKNRATFDAFVDDFYNFKVSAKISGDKLRELLFKYVLNSGYGKFSQNPRRFREYCITHLNDPRPDDTWDIASLHEELDPAICIWSRPTKTRFQGYYNICIGASITGAARSLLLRGLRASVRPIYCDTDSIIAESITGRGIVISDTELGGWKLEGSGNMAAIGGKKLYAIYDTTKPANNQCGGKGVAKDSKQYCKSCKGSGCDSIKKAHKGARLTGAQILKIARGAVIDYANPVPSFRYAFKDLTPEFKPKPGKTGWKFTTRRIRRTSNV